VVSTSERHSRVDAAGFAYAGSMLQTQLYVNDHTAELDSAILTALPALARLRPKVQWVSPLRADGYREFWDAAFLRTLGFPELAAGLGEWWPRRGGPHWDALARLEFADGTAGALLAEGKSYPGEMYDKKGCSASSVDSLAKIRTALVETQRWLGVDRPVESWLRPLYQTANRLATLHWLMEQLDGRAWLVHLCFINDPTHIRSTRGEWDDAFDAAGRALGIERPVPNYAHVFLEGLPRPAAL
jgi:aromatic ring-cleaving dioxygenase